MRKALVLLVVCGTLISAQVASASRKTSVEFLNSGKVLPTQLPFSDLLTSRSSIETPNFRAMLLMVSPALMVYVKGVRLGSGVSAATRGSGVWLGFWVDVK